MSARFITRTMVCAAVVLLSGFALRADVTGADPRLTGAPGDSVCTQCHTGSTLNGGGGSVRINLPTGNTYTPGVKQHISVTVSDPTQQRWGFELTARLASNLTNGQAGSLASTDNLTQVTCDTVRRAPCSSASVVQFITHTMAGTRLGTKGSATFEFDWTPPDTDLGNIRLYAAGNAANGNTQDTGDHIYTTSVELTTSAVVPKPTISDGGVLNAANAVSGIALFSWITIKGSNLAATTRTWTLDEIATGQMPISLDNVSVTLNGNLAFVQYVSPTQVNVLAPADDSLGPVEVRVTSNGQTSDPAMVNLQPFAPGLFTLDGKYLAATLGNNSMLNQSAAFFTAAGANTTVQAGDTVVFYGTGFGKTNPSIIPGEIPALDANITSAQAITIGGVAANIISVVLAAGLPDIYQLSVQVPVGLPDGDQQVVVQLGGASSPAGSDCCFLTLLTLTSQAPQ